MLPPNCTGVQRACNNSMTMQQLSMLVSSIDDEIHAKQLQLQYLQLVHLPARHEIPPLPQSLPQFVPPPSSKTLSYVRRILDSRRASDRMKNGMYRSSIGKVNKSHAGKNPWRSHVKQHRQATLAHHKDRILKEERDLQLVAQIHGLRPDSPGAARKLRAIRRREETSCKMNHTKGEMDSKRATIPPQPLSSFNFNGFVSCMSPKIPNAKQYVQLSNIINPWTVNEKFYFLRLYVQYGKDFQNIAQQLTYKSVHDCVRLYYSQKLHFCLKELYKSVKSGEMISDEKIMTLASKGIITCKIPDNICHVTDNPSCASVRQTIQYNT